MKKPPRALVIDGNNLIYRCYYGMGYLSTPAGQVIHGAFGTVKRVMEALRLFKPERMLVCWDGSQSFKSWRHSVYAGYKDRSKRNHNEMARLTVDEQILIAMKILGDDMLIPQIRGPLVEGDDAVSVVAAKLVSDGYRPVLMSPDHDFIQLVSEHVSVYDPMKVHWVKAENFTDETGHVSPEAYLDYMIVNGDTGDGVPIVKGLSGEKRWHTKWKQHFEEFALCKMLTTKAWFERHCPEAVRAEFLPRFDELHRNWKLLDLKHARTKVWDEVFEFWPEERHDFDKERLAKSCRQYAFNSILAEMDEWDGIMKAYHGRKM